MKRAMLLALALVSNSALAARWVPISTGASNEQTAVDVSSIRLAGQIRYASVKVSYAPHTQKSLDGASLKYVGYTLNREAFNCRDGMHRAEALSTHFIDGSDNSAGSELLPTPWEPVVPDSVGGEVISLVCAWKSK